MFTPNPSKAHISVFSLTDQYNHRQIAFFEVALYTTLIKPKGVFFINVIALRFSSPTKVWIHQPHSSSSKT
jgi:hypothetical protein